MARLHGPLEPVRGVLAGEQHLAGPGQGIVTIGKPSGAHPIFLEPGLYDPLDAMPSVKEAQNDRSQRPTEDWEMRVRSGDVLSRIVRIHYGRVSHDLEQRLARYNSISDPDRLVIGQVLYLPAEERLVEGTP